MAAPRDVVKLVPPQHKSTADLDRVCLRRGPAARPYWKPRLYAERGRLPDAHQEGPGTAGLEIFQANPEMMIHAASSAKDCKLEKGGLASGASELPLPEGSRERVCP